MLLQWHRTWDWVDRHKERIGLIVVGQTAKRIEEFLFDTVLYGTVVAICTIQLGPLLGPIVTLAVMTPISALACYGYLRFYDWSKKDWLGLEALKALREGNTLLHRVVRYGNVPAFFALSVFSDAFATVVYLRGKERYEGLTTRDRKIFWASIVVSNAYWTLRWTAIVQAALFFGEWLG